MIKREDDTKYHRKDVESQQESKLDIAEMKILQWIKWSHKTS